MQLTLDGPTVALPIFVGSQAIATLIWGARMEVRMTNAEKTLQRIGPALDAIARLETDMKTVKGRTGRIEDKLDSVPGMPRSFRTHHDDDDGNDV